MGREIRQVPANWNHPKNDQGHYIALHDQTYEQALGDWKQYKPDEGDSYEKWAEWAEDVPSAEWCRPAYDAPADHFQIYETVSEGTPVSPVFATRDELAQWLIEQGHSEKAARQFAIDGWAISMVFDPPHGVVMDIETCAI